MVEVIEEVEAPKSKQGRRPGYKASPESIAKAQVTKRANAERKAQAEKEAQFLVSADSSEFLQEEKNPTRPVKAESAPDVNTGLTKEDAEEMRQEVRLQAAEARIKEAALSEDTQRLMVHQEIKIDSCSTLRRYVELTPSMCRARNCPWDAAKEAGATDWNNAPINQPMSDGRIFGDRLIAMREYHEATAHTARAMDDHIVTAEELNKRHWGIGQDIKGEFLTGAR